FVVFAILLLGLMTLWMLRSQTSNDVQYISHGLIIACTFTVLLAPHFPWYFAWLLPFLCFVPSVSVIYLTLRSFLLYLTWFYWTDDPVFRIKVVMFVPFFLLVAFSLRKAFQKFKLKVATTEGVAP